MDIEAAATEIGQKLPFYRGWTTNALSNKRHDNDLIQELRRVKRDWDSVTDDYRAKLEEFDKPGLREGREHVLESFREGEKYCGALASALGQVIERLNSF